jgi:hypothetical protein
MCNNPAAVPSERPQAILNGVDAWLSFRSIELYRVYRHYHLTTSIDRKRWPFENDLLELLQLFRGRRNANHPVNILNFQIFKDFSSFFQSSEFMK